MQFTELETKRLKLKSIGAEDREFIFSEFSDDNVNHYLYDAEPMQDISEADELINFYTCPEPREQHRWILVQKSDGQKIGTCGFHCRNVSENSIEIGYDMKKEFWGNGYMQEAVNATINFARTNLKIQIINAHISTDNIRSVALAEKLGFKFNGETVIYTFRGKDYLHHVYTLNV